MNWRITLLLAAVALLGLATEAPAAGTLTPVGSPDAPIQIRDHHVRVVIHNGFALTEVTQTFYNPNPVDLEGLYVFPVPTSASLSEMTIVSGEKEIHGEVMAEDEARQVYEDERSRGKDAGLASKNGYQTFEFRVSPIRQQDETRVRFLYYQPLEIDTGVGRYLYPLEAGGTNEVARSFWLPNQKVEGTFSLELELKSAWQIAEVRVPGFESEAVVNELAEGHHRVRLERQNATLDRDFVFYYRLADDLPGRIELIPYRAEGDGPGTFMLVVTPGLDLQPITGGADYLFVLDVSGSMAGKIQTLARGVSKALGEMEPGDRFRIVTFSSADDELTRGWVDATPENLSHWAKVVEGLQTGGSTNMYAGIQRGLSGLDDDRATSLVLVTDAVTNTGIVDSRKFHELMKQYDVRLFGFLMGNSANWPLMRLVTEASGGHYAQISNADDVIGQLLLAKSKVTHEALHDAELEIRGVKTYDTTGRVVGKIYRGQQLVLFGRYEDGGEATLRLDARLTGQDKTYQTGFEFPAVATDHPELERLWALSRIEEIQTLADTGLLPASEAGSAIRDLGIDYQLVTDETSMVVLDDDAFERHGIERRNQARAAIEHAAQARRRSQPVQSRRVDSHQPIFDQPAPSLGGGGAIGPLGGALALGLGALTLTARRHSRADRAEPKGDRR
jgi:Ca-activated chloride channel family protein